MIFFSTSLECVVATKGTPMEGKPFTFRADPRVLPVLAKHFPIVSLANNHTGDFGSEAFVEQLDLLKQQGISWFGGGHNCAEARTPHIIQIKGLRIALLGSLVARASWMMGLFMAMMSRGLCPAVITGQPQHAISSQAPVSL